MKKALSLILLIGAIFSAHAQSPVTVYGDVDAGIIDQTSGVSIGRRDHNRLGFRGTEDLGDGLKALYQLEMRYEPDTGTVEAGNRPLFQGQSRVGLEGAFGTIRLGRALTAAQEASGGFDPWNTIPSQAGFQTDLAIAGFNSDPLGPPGNSQNRMSNGIFYNSPLISGAQLNVTYGTKEAQAAGTPRVTPCSVAATYTSGAFQAAVANERNAVDSRLWLVAGAYYPIKVLKLMVLYAKQDRGVTLPASANVSSWLVGANYTIGAGKALIGYGRKSPDNSAETTELSLGYEYSLSKRTYLYADASRKRQAITMTPLTSSVVKYYNLGIHQNF